MTVFIRLLVALSLAVAIFSGCWGFIGANGGAMLTFIISASAFIIVYPLELIYGAQD